MFSIRVMLVVKSFNSKLITPVDVFELLIIEGLMSVFI